MSLDGEHANKADFNSIQAGSDIGELCDGSVKVGGRGISVDMGRLAVGGNDGLCCEIDDVR